MYICAYRAGCGIVLYLYFEKYIGPFLFSSLAVDILRSIQSHVLHLRQFSRALKNLSEESVVDAKDSENDKGTCRDGGRAVGP